MARKYKIITELYQRTITEITSPQEWRRFLTTACRNFRLSFDEQVLLYAQRPDATAVLPIEGANGWNKRFGRWVNRGATGIAVFDRDYIGRSRLKYYFDISDTHKSRFARPVPPSGRCAQSMKRRLLKRWKTALENFLKKKALLLPCCLWRKMQ